MDKIKESISYTIAVYLRLSKEDEDLYSKSKYESNSIANQRAMILNEIEQMPSNVSLYNIYIDDGYTGLNFERPGFRRMMEDIHSGLVNMVVVKDLSRLGRDYIETGRLIKKEFPRLNVRFLSVLDRYDSLNATISDTNLLMPVKNFVNDNYSRETSIRIRSHLQVMRKQGLYVGAYVCYGYLKSKEDKNKLIVDEYAAEVIRNIYDWYLSGLSIQGIADTLNALGVLAPAEYKRHIGINYKTGFQTNQVVLWSYKAVERILKNKMYLGMLIQGKREKVNYKLSKVIEKPESKMTVIEGGSPQIISHSKFANVQRLLRCDTKVQVGKDTLYPFSGFLFCADCGRSMTRRKPDKKGNIRYICTTYNNGKGCTRHSVSVSLLDEILKNAINKHIELLESIENVLKTTEELQFDKKSIIVSDADIREKREELGKCEKLVIGLYRNYSEGILSASEYKEMKQIYTERIEHLQNAIDEIQQKIDESFDRGLTNNAWIEEFKSYRNIKCVNRQVLVNLVDKIIIYENQRIEIRFMYNDECLNLCRIARTATEHFQLERGVR